MSCASRATSTPTIDKYEERLGELAVQPDAVAAKPGPTRKSEALGNLVVEVSDDLASSEHGRPVVEPPVDLIDPLQMRLEDRRP